MKRKNESNCFECSNCQYLGGGDYYCDQYNEVVLVDFNFPTDEYLCCDGKDFVPETDS